MASSRSRAHQPDSLRKTFAKNVRLVRIHLLMSQEALADECGLDRTFVSSLERGLRNISIDNIERIARALREPAPALLDPTLASQRGFDITATRAPRTAPSRQVKRARS